MAKLSYINSRGEHIEVVVTQHARNRFSQRWLYVFPTKPLPESWDDTIALWFAKAQRLNVISPKYRTRLRRHGKDTLYYLASPFVFVIQSTILRTVELGTNATRLYNNNAPNRTDRICSSINSAAIEADTAPHRLPFFRVGVNAFDEDGNLKTVNLGSYDSESCGGKAEKLIDDQKFRPEIVLRFECKRPNWKLSSIFVKLGNDGQIKIVYSNA